MHQVKFLVDKNQLHLLFDTEENLTTCLAALQDKGIDLLTASEGSKSILKAYNQGDLCGWFLSPEGRIGLLFPSEHAKFFFIETLGIPSESYMDMGPGFSKQLHFNAGVFPFIDQKSFTITTEYDSLRP